MPYFNAWDKWYIISLTFTLTAWCLPFPWTSPDGYGTRGCYHRWHWYNTKLLTSDDVGSGSSRTCSVVQCYRRQVQELKKMAIWIVCKMLALLANILRQKRWLIYCSRYSSKYLLAVVLYAYAWIHFSNVKNTIIHTCPFVLHGPVPPASHREILL